MASGVFRRAFFAQQKHQIDAAGDDENTQENDQAGKNFFQRPESLQLGGLDGFFKKQARCWRRAAF